MFIALTFVAAVAVGFTAGYIISINGWGLLPLALFFFGIALSVAGIYGWDFTLAGSVEQASTNTFFSFIAMLVCASLGAYITDSIRD